MSIRISHVAAGLCAMLVLTASNATDVCGSPFNQAPVLKPVMAVANFTQSDAAVDCFMWQTFIYLNWPAANGQRGQPDPNAAFGSSGPTVWETYKTVDEVFLKNGKAPGPWNDLSVQNAQFHARGLKQVQPGLRLLSNKTKFFRPLTGIESASLKETEQAGGGILYDQGSQPVYYEMLMDQANFSYIVDNQLYNANQQYQFATSTGIALPTGALEVKAAWKVLSPQELSANPVRFHTAQALLPGNTKPVTVGLVGLHIFQMPSSSFNQGFWATFEQADNAPLASGGMQQTSYSFNNPQCSAAACPPNQRTNAGTPTQVVQKFGSTPEAQAVNAYVQNQLAPGAPWQFYQLISVQWPTSPQAIGQSGQQAPLPNGSPNTTTLMNPVLETFRQKQTVSCLACHRGASVATPGNVSTPLPLASSYSFLLGHATYPVGSKTSEGTEAKKPGK